MSTEKSAVVGVGLCRDVESSLTDDLATIGWATLLENIKLLYRSVSKRKLINDGCNFTLVACNSSISSSKSPTD